MFEIAAILNGIIYLLLMVILDDAHPINILMIEVPFPDIFFSIILTTYTIWWSSQSDIMVNIWG